MQFTQFEQELLSWFADHAEQPSVAEQLRHASPRVRHYTGVGLFLYLEVPRSTEPIPDGAESPISGPEISSNALAHGGGSLLFNEGGFAKFLEVYTFDDLMSGDLADFHFDVLEPKKTHPAG